MRFGSIIWKQALNIKLIGREARYLRLLLFCWLATIATSLTVGSFAYADVGKKATISKCLNEKIQRGNYSVCIGAVADGCLNNASNTDGTVQRLSTMADCYDLEREAWADLLKKAVVSWKASSPAIFASSIERAVESQEVFMEMKCVVFQDVQQFGVSGMVLEAQCRNEETARMAIFIGYALD